MVHIADSLGQSMIGVTDCSLFATKSDRFSVIDVNLRRPAAMFIAVRREASCHEQGKRPRRGEMGAGTLSVTDGPSFGHPSLGLLAQLAELRTFNP